MLERIVSFVERAEQTPEDVRVPDVVGAIHELLFDPIARAVVARGGPPESGRSDENNEDRHKQFVAEQRFAIPMPQEWLPNVRLALKKDKAPDDLDPASYHTAALGVDVAHRCPIAGHPAHLRWGFWTHAAKGKNGGLVPPFRAIQARCRRPDRFDVLHRPVTGIRAADSFWLTFLGVEVSAAKLRDRSDLATLVDEIAADLNDLAHAIRRS